MFKYRSRTLFEAAFGAFDPEVNDFIRQWSEIADEEALARRGGLGDDEI